MGLCDESGRIACTALWEDAQMTVGAALRFVYVGAVCITSLGLRKAMHFCRLLLLLETKRHHYAPTALHLQLLCTSPSMQGRGLGAKIIEVGIARAEMRGVPCYLES